MQNFDKMDHMHFIRKLPIPQELKKEMPLTPELAAYKDKRDQEIAAIIRSESDKLLLVIGPCSADREDAVIDYIHRLAEVQKQVADKILIVPRIYTGKPRTTGAGYKGMLHQPDPGKKPDMYEGIRAIRHIHLRALQETGLSCADEMLYPENHRYLSDLLSYVAVGARSVENQEHRLISSGLDIPVGMKNPMSGDLSVMINAIKAAHGDHSFIYRGWEVESQGNPLSHAILRGSVDRHGINHANYHYENLRILHAGSRRHPNQHAAVAHQIHLSLLNGRDNIFVVVIFLLALRCHLHIDEHLRINGHNLCQLRQLFAAFHHCLK